MSLNDCEWMLIAKWEVMAGISYIQWDDNDAHFVFEQHTQLDFYSTNSLKQQSVSRYVTSRAHIILIPSQPVFAFSP
jgi:hypothetical protein